MLSVISAFRETLELWWRHIRYIAPIAVVLGTPLILVQYLIAAISSPEPSFWLVPVSFASFAFQTLMGAVTAAAILGVLKAEHSQGMPVLDSVKNTIRIYTWTLFRMMLILMLIGMAIGIVFGCVMSAIVSANMSTTGHPTPSPALGFLGVIGVAVFLIFLKYALADPIIVLEGRGAQESLLRSWDMTKGRFGYVLGCYVFLWFGSWLIDWPLLKLAGYVTFVDFPVQMIICILESLWVVMAWVMYFQIKAVDQPEAIWEQPEPLS